MDPTSTSDLPSSWKELLAELKQLLHDASSKSANSKIEKCSLRILEMDGKANGRDDADTSLPSYVRKLISTIYLRALIKLEKFTQVLDHCNQLPLQSGEEEGDSDHVLERAYALYRLRRYDACRRLCSHSLRDGNDDTRKGMMHIYAQTLFRLGETKEADVIYSQILSRSTESDSAHLFANMDADEREDSLANAFANRTSNYTCGSLLSQDGTAPWLEEDEIVKSFLQTYGSVVTPRSAEDEGEMLQNYDLAYNLATYLLVSSDSRPQKYIVRARNLLTRAEKSALTVLESTSDGNTGSVQDMTDEEKAKRQQNTHLQQLLAEQEAGPIRANLAYANMLLGGSDNEAEAFRTYLTLVTKAGKDNSRNKGVSSVQANLLATASNNLAVLRDGKESVFDVLKRIPTTSSISVSEDGVSGKGVKGGSNPGNAASGGASTVPLVGATPHQVRTVLYNRALQLAKMGNVSSCLDSLAVLRASLEVSYSGDNHVVSEKSKANGEAKKNVKSKKKKCSDQSNSGSNDDGIRQSPVDRQNVPTAKPSCDMGALAWNARADWVESELRRISGSSDKRPEDIINSAISKLDLATEGSSADEESTGVLSYMKAQLLLHKTAVVNGQSRPQPLITSLESLPSLVRTCPGTTITLASLYGALNNEESTSRSVELMTSLGESISARLSTALLHLERGRYDEAIDLLKRILEEEDSSATEDMLVAKGLLVQSLSNTDPDKAEEYLDSLQAVCAESSLNGEELESMEIPRFAKRVIDPASSGKGASDSSSKARSIITATAGKRGADKSERAKTNRDAILRKRAKKREAYLKQLEAKGLYDRNKQPKPDPERWIPKSQRSYNRRGRRGRYNTNIGAQGGGAGVGMEKEAAKLDVAARVSAAKSGDASGPVKLSTANMQVSGSGPVRKGKAVKRR